MTENWIKCEKLKLWISWEDIDHYLRKTDPKKYRGFVYNSQDNQENGREIVFEIGPYWTVEGSRLVIPEDKQEMDRLYNAIAGFRPCGGIFGMAFYGAQNVYLCGELDETLPQLLLENDFDPTVPVKRPSLISRFVLYLREHLIKV